MLSINIITINGVDEGRRGLLLMAKDRRNIERFESILQYDGYDKVDQA